VVLARGAMMHTERARSLGYLLVGLADLADKYEALEQLGAAQPGRTVERRDAMRKIAARFPAALREFDQSGASALAARRHAIETLVAELISDLEQGRALGSLARPERAWLPAAAELHAYMRELLKVKRWLAGRQPTRDVLDGLPSWYGECADPRWPLSHWSPDRLARIAQPPRGRVTDLAYEEVAARHGLDPSELRSQLYPPPDEGPKPNGG
jgi:hypothetical protein